MLFRSGDTRGAPTVSRRQADEAIDGRAGDSGRHPDFVVGQPREGGQLEQRAFFPSGFEEDCRHPLVRYEDIVGRYVVTPRSPHSRHVPGLEDRTSVVLGQV